MAPTDPLTMDRAPARSTEVEHDGPEERVVRASCRPSMVTTTVISQTDDPPDDSFVAVDVALDLVLEVVPSVVLVPPAVAAPPSRWGGPAIATTDPPSAMSASGRTSVRVMVVVVSFMALRVVRADPAGPLG